MTEKLPYFPLYVDAFDTDDLVIPMTYEAEGVYNALLRFQWRHGTVPDDLRSALPKAVNPEALEQVRPCFTVLKGSQPSRSFNPKLERIRERVSRRRKKQSEGGREGGIRSGLSRRRQAEGKLEGNLKLTRTIASSYSSSSSEASTPQGTEKEHRVRSGAAPRKETWLTPFADDWEAACGGEPSYPKLGRYFKKLVEKHGTEKVREHWRNFLAETDPQYVNPATFAEKFGSYGADRPQRLTAKQREERELALWATKGEPDGI